MKSKDNYVPFSEEWVKEMMKIPKKRIIERFLRPALIHKHALQQPGPRWVKDEVDFLEECIRITKNGGWSTHLVGPMQDRIAKLKQLYFDESPASTPSGEGMAEALRLLDTASNLVGNPGTNISSSTDLACDSWQEKYKKFIASLSPGVEDGSGWVSLVDKLPDYGTIDVWVSEYHHKGRMPNVEYRKRDFHNKSDRFEAYMHTDSGMQWVDITNMVTHWRPLPTPPGVEDNQTKKQ